MLYLSSYKAHEKVRYGTEGPDNRTKQPGSITHGTNKHTRPAYGVLNSSGFRCYLAEDQHDERDKNGRNELTQSFRETQGQDGCHAGSNYNSYAINNQDGREEHVWVVKQVLDFSSPYIAFFYEIPKFNAADGSK